MIGAILGFLATFAISVFNKNKDKLKEKNDRDRQRLEKIYYLLISLTDDVSQYYLYIISLFYDDLNEKKPNNSYLATRELSVIINLYYPQLKSSLENCQNHAKVMINYEQSLEIAELSGYSEEVSNNYTTKVSEIYTLNLTAINELKYKVENIIIA